MPEHRGRVISLVIQAITLSLSLVHVGVVLIMPGRKPQVITKIATGAIVFRYFSRIMNEYVALLLIQTILYPLYVSSNITRYPHLEKAPRSDCYVSGSNNDTVNWCLQSKQRQNLSHQRTGANISCSPFDGLQCRRH